MAEQESYFWAGTFKGDAALSPYYSNAFNLLNSFFITADQATEGIIPTRHSSFSSCLNVSAPGGVTVRVGSGLALIDGHLYTSDANEDFSATIKGWYSVFLSLNYSTQEVRLDLAGPGDSFPPDPLLISGSVWQLKLATLFSTGAAITDLVDERIFIRNVSAQFRKGAHASHWSGYAGTTTYRIDKAMIEFGSTLHKTNVSFPKAYTYYPIIIACPRYQDVPSAGFPTQFSIGAILQGYTTFVWDDSSDVDSLLWISIGR